MNPTNGLPIVMKGRDSGTSITQKPKERKMSKERIVRIVLGALLALGVPLMAQADEAWTAVGQTGSMDDNALNPVNFTKSTSGLYRATGVTSTIAVWWNVENVNAPDVPTWGTLSLLNYDNSAGNTIHVELIQVDRTNGTLTTIAGLISSDSASTKYDTVSFYNTWDFARYSYFIYGYIYGTDATSQPVIKAVTVRD
jgi:hypothetical protein